MFVPDPNSIRIFRASGTSDMATVTDAQPSPRFGLAEPYLLLFVRAWFSGGAGTSPTMTLKQKIVDSPSGFFDNTLRLFPQSGTDDEDFQDFRVQADELYHWRFDAGDWIVPEWTNPNTEGPSDPMRWAIEVGLAPVPRE